MTKPNNLKDLLTEGHITLGEVKKIARDIFNGSTTGAGPEGYLITAVSFDKLPDHVQGFIVKAILEFKVENVLDRKPTHHDLEDHVDRLSEPAFDNVENFRDGNAVYPQEDDNFEPPTVGNEVV